MHGFSSVGSLGSLGSFVVDQSTKRRAWKMDVPQVFLPSGVKAPKDFDL